MLLGFFYILFKELLWALVMLLSLFIKFLLGYWCITLLIVCGLITWGIIDHHKLMEIQKELSINSPDEPKKSISSQDKILRLFKGRNIRLKAEYIQKKLQNLPDLDTSLDSLIKSNLLTKKEENHTIYYIITYNGVKERNKNLYKYQL